MFQNDYLLRIIQQAAEAIARMLGLRDKGDYAAALRQADSAWDLLGVPRELLEVADSASVAGFLRHPDSIRVAARLCAEEARLHELRGDSLTAFARYRRALELLLEARLLDPGFDDREELRDLAARVPQQHLAERYRAPLD
jgi:tetratricopeptide (TPR) repeat protein